MTGSRPEAPFARGRLRPEVRRPAGHSLTLTATARDTAAPVLGVWHWAILERNTVIPARLPLHARCRVTPAVAEL